jgi:ribonuclease R
LVHISSLGKDYYQFDPIAHRLLGERSGQTYQIGDPVEIRVARVDLDERKIDFELLSPVATGNERDTKNKKRSTTKHKGKSTTKNKRKTKK